MIDIKTQYAGLTLRNPYRRKFRFDKQRGTKQGI